MYTQQIFVIITLHQTSALIIQTSAPTIPFYCYLSDHELHQQTCRYIVSHMLWTDAHQKVRDLNGQILLCIRKLLSYVLKIWFVIINWLNQDKDQSKIRTQECSLCSFKQSFLGLNIVCRWFTNYLRETMIKPYQYW